MPRQSSRERRPSTRRAARSRLRLALGIGALLAFALVVGVVATGVVERLIRADVGAVDGPDLAAQVRRPDAPLSPEQLAGDLHYVALGDSYSAGPGIPEVQAGAGTCARSTANYPSLLAGWLRADDVRDVTCSGATTLDLAAEAAKDPTVAPQLDALTDDTDVVTLGMGGNDYSLYSRLVNTCPTDDFATVAGAPCRERFQDAGGDILLRTTASIGDRVTDAVAEVRAAAPRAAVVVVGYPQLFPTGRTCEDLAFAEGDATWAAQVLESLDARMREAATRAGVRYVDVMTASRGHDICSADPWINGAADAPGVAWRYHPLPEGMRAVAEVVYQALTGSPAPTAAATPRGRG